MTNEQIAKVCHDANKSFCETQGDFTQKSWEDAAEWQRESAVKGVGFRVKNPNAHPSQQHEAWSKDKVEQGWVYGEVKDEVAKTHPCLVPYNELPEFQRLKDSLFQGVVDALKY